MMLGAVLLSSTCCYCCLQHLLLLLLLSCCSYIPDGFAVAATASSSAAAIAATEPPPYSTYVLEELCNGEEVVIPVYLKAWSAAIFTLGYAGDGEYYDRDKHTCTLKVSTEEDFHLGGVVESIRIQGVQHPTTKRWECDDYIVFRTKSAGLVNKVLGMILPDRLFKGRESEQLCGERYLDTSKVFRMVGTSSHSNVFSTMANKLELEYHQNSDLRTLVNNSFTVVISTFRNINEHECSGDERTMCNGGGGTSSGTRTKQIYCIHSRYHCDGHINCALPGGGTDERNCPRGEVAGLSQYSVVFSSTIIIFIALGSIVGAMVLLVILYSLVSRARGDSNRSSPAESTTAVNYSASSESADIAPSVGHRRKSRGNRSNRRHDSIDEEDYDNRDRDRGDRRSRSGGEGRRARREGGGRKGEGGGRGGGDRDRDRGRRSDNNNRERRTVVIADPIMSMATRRQNSLPGYNSVVNQPQIHQQPIEDKTQPLQQPLIGVNQYNNYNRVNNEQLNSHLNPSAPDILPYPPSYDILFPTDG